MNISIEDFINLYTSKKALYVKLQEQGAYLDNIDKMSLQYLLKSLLKNNCNILNNIYLHFGYMYDRFQVKLNETRSSIFKLYNLRSNKSHSRSRICS